MKKVTINWSNVNYEVISVEKYNDKLKELKASDLKEILPTLIRRPQFFYKTYQMVKTDSYIELRICDENADLFKLRVSFTGVKTGNENAGHEGYIYVNNMFKEKYGENKSIYTSFGGQKYKELNKEIKRCVITQVDYVSRLALGRIFDSCYKSDVSSAYPYQMTKNLPTMHDCKVLEGRVEPTEEYPFAFYVNSHHVKIYNELYTRDFGKSRYYRPYFDPSLKWRPYDSVKPEDDKTILCKTSEYSLKDIFEEIYSHRKEKPELKLYMVAMIGYLHKNTNPFLSQIAAVVLARCANEMIKRAEQLDKEGNLVILINTDSIIWKGQQSSLSQKEKKIGNFCVEYENTKVCVKGIKAYQILKADGTADTKHAGLPKEISRSLGFGEILNQLDIRINNRALIITPEGYLEEIDNGKAWS